MRSCTECGGQLQESTATTPEGIAYHFSRCKKCGEEVVDMKQLHAVAEQYRMLKKYHVKLSKWGLSLGIRIPKELVEKYHLKDDEEVAIVPEKKGLRIIPP